VLLEDEAPGQTLLELPDFAADGLAERVALDLLDEGFN
jgi:hypothetical protein